MTPYTFSLYALINVSCLTLFFFTGTLIRSLTVRETKTRPYHFFLSILAGMTLWITGWALWQTHGISICLLFVLLGFLYLYSRRSFILRNYKNHSLSELLTGYDSYKKIFQHAGITFVILLLTLLQQSFWVSWSGEYIYLHNDLFYYSNLSEFLNITHQENTFTAANLLNHHYHGTTPYHYYELWLNAGICEIFGIQKVQGLQLICYPLLFTVLASGIVLYARSQGASWWMAASTLLIIFIEPWNIINLNGIEGFTIVNISHSIKYLPPALFLLAFLIKLLDKEVNIFYLLAACVSSTVLLPSIGGGLMLYALLLLLLRKFIPGLALLSRNEIMIIAIFMVAYVVFNTATSNHIFSPEPYLSADLLLGQYRTIINIIAGTLIYLVYMFLPLLLINAFLFPYLKEKLKQKDISFIRGAALLCSIIMAGTLSFGVFFALTDAVQLFSISAILICCLLFICLYIEGINYLSGYKKIAYAGLYLAVGLVGIFHAFQFQKNYTYSLGSGHSIPEKKYISTVLARINHQEEQHRIGFSISNPSKMISVFEKNISVYSAANFIALGARRSALVSLNGPEIPIDSSSALKALREYNLINLGIFYNYCRKESISLALDACRLEFIKKNHLSFGFFKDSTCIPENFRPLIKYQLTDKFTGLIYAELDLN